MEIINEEHNLLAVGPELLPEEYRGHILMFYVPKLDAVALSKDNPVFALLAEFMKEYLSAQDHVRKSVMNEYGSEEASQDLIDIMHVLNRVIRIRRKLHRCKTVTGAAGYLNDVKLSENSGGGLPVIFLCGLGWMCSTTEPRAVDIVLQ